MPSEKNPQPQKPTLEERLLTLKSEYEARRASLVAELERLKLERKQLESIETEKSTSTPEEEISGNNQEENRVEGLVQEIEDTIIENSDDAQIMALEENAEEIKKESPSLFRKIKKIIESASTKIKRKMVKYVYLPVGVLALVMFSYDSPKKYYEMFQNYKERHFDKIDEDDPRIIGIDSLYSKSKIERATFDFLGRDSIDYKFGYYVTSVFDLSDKTPPRFKIINGRENYTQIDSVAGITTSLFEEFQEFDTFKPRLKGHLKQKTIEEIREIPVIGYNKKEKIIRAGHLKEFNEDWLVSETYEVPLDFRLNEDGTINLTYPPATLRMTPVTINEEGKPIPFPIGVTRDKNITRYNPYEATSFGVLEGGKVIMVCGDQQLQVNGSFADMYRVYERLKQENSGAPISAYFLDNGSYNLPIWDTDNTLTPAEIRQHLNRHKGGGTALVLIDDEKISPYEYKNQYPEFQHYTPNYTLDSLAAKRGEKKPALNEKLAIVLHHTGNYKDPNLILEQFADTTNEKSSHVVIFKDGTRHLFNTDDYVLAHAGKSVFADRNKVNFFSIGVELEGDSRNGFTIAQMESLLEYLLPRIEKYEIPFEMITTHKNIRDEYMRRFPEDRAETKRDLEEGVWEQIRDLIYRKIYAGIGRPLDLEGAKMIGLLEYQDEYRKTKNQNTSILKTREILNHFNVPREMSEEVISYITNNNPIG